MALLTLLGPDILGSGHVREHHHGSVHGLAGNCPQQQYERAGCQCQAAPPSLGEYFPPGSIATHDEMLGCCSINCAAYAVPFEGLVAMIWFISVLPEPTCPRCSAGLKRRRGCGPPRCRR